MRTAFVVDAVRTPIGKFRGGLSSVRPDDLAAHVLSALLERSPTLGSRLDHVVFGATNQAGEDNRNIARMAVLLNYRIAWLQSKGKVPNAEASMTKLVTERLRQTLAQTGMDVAGLYGLLALDSPKEPWAGEIGDYYLEGPHFTLAGGTPEIQRNIIAQRGLELPR